MSTPLAQLIREAFPQAPEETVAQTVTRLESEFETLADQRVEHAQEQWSQEPVKTDWIEVAGQPRRETIEIVEEHGLRIELDAGGYATFIHCDRGFIA